MEPNKKTQNIPVKHYMTCQLRVDTQSPGWHKTMIKVLNGVKGVSYNVDVETGITHVSGDIDPATLLKKLKKAGKGAELIWVDSGPHQLHANATMPKLPGNGYGYGLNPFGNGYGYGYYGDYDYSQYAMADPYVPLPLPTYPHPYNYQYYDPLYDVDPKCSIM
ncbi:heavy metal-associated isoprenylated plant protein 32-like [Fagus crenata]